MRKGGVIQTRLKMSDYTGAFRSGSNALTIGTAVQPGSVTYRYDTYESEDTTGDFPHNQPLG